MKTVKEAKSRLVVGARLLCVENTYRPELNGSVRVVTKAGATVWQWKFEGKEDERPSHSVWPSGIKIIDADTIRIPMSTGRGEHYLTLKFLDPVGTVHPAAEPVLAKPKQMVVRVGMQWTNADGRTWEVVENLHFGKFRVCTTDRTKMGELRASTIRKNVADAIERDARAQQALDAASEVAA